MMRIRPSSGPISSGLNIVVFLLRDTNTMPFEVWDQNIGGINNEVVLITRWLRTNKIRS